MQEQTSADANAQVDTLLYGVARGCMSINTQLNPPVVCLHSIKMEKEKNKQTKNPTKNDANEVSIEGFVLACVSFLICNTVRVISDTLASGIYIGLLPVCVYVSLRAYVGRF